MEGPISSRNQDRQGTTGNQETIPPLSPWPGPFVVSEYVALPGDRIAVAAMDPATGIMCPGRDDRDQARADAQALNAAYQLGRRLAEEAVRSAYDHIRMTAIPGGNGHFLVPEAAIAEMRSALFTPDDARRRESLVSGCVGRPAAPVGRNPDACTNEQKPSYRQARESLAKLFDEQAADAGRLAHLFDDIDQAELVAALESIASANARKVRESRLVAAKVDRAAIPEGRATPACDNELLAAVNSAGENDGSLQHTPTTWVGNELVNHPVGGGA